MLGEMSFTKARCYIMNIELGGGGGGGGRGRLSKNI